MKVLLTHERFPPDFGGGGEHHVLETAKNLAKRGVDVRVLTAGDPRVSSYEGIPTVRLPIRRHSFNLAVGKIVKLARDVDLIQTFNYHACLPSWLAGKWLRKPVVCLNLCVLQDAWLAMKGRFFGRAFRAGEKFLLTRDFARVLFLSDYNRRMGIEVGVSRERSSVIGPAFAVHEYSPAAEKEDVILFAGKLEARKGFHDVLQVAKELPQARFQVLGWGPGEAALKRMAPPNVEFAGFLEGQKFRDAFARARIFLLPTRAEGFPLVLLYAMASGCAVVCTLPLEFEGVYVPAGDLEKLSRSVERLWSDREETRRIGQRNVARAQHYTWDRYTDFLLAVYEEVLREHRLARQDRK